MAQIDIDIEAFKDRCLALQSKLHKMQKTVEDGLVQYKLIKQQKTQKKTADGNYVNDANGPIYEYSSPKSQLAPYEEIPNTKRQSVLDECNTEITAVEDMFVDDDG